MGRISGCLSVTQELTTHVEIERAVAFAARACRVTTLDFGAAADVAVDGTAKSRYLLFVEFQDGAAPADLGAFARAFDEGLCKENRVYREHRTARLRSSRRGSCPSSRAGPCASSARSRAATSRGSLLHHRRYEKRTALEACGAECSHDSLSVRITRRKAKEIPRCHEPHWCRHHRSQRSSRFHRDSPGRADTRPGPPPGNAYREDRRPDQRGDHRHPRPRPREHGLRRLGPPARERLRGRSSSTRS